MAFKSLKEMVIIVLQIAKRFFKKKIPKRTDGFPSEVKFPKTFVPLVKTVWVVLLGKTPK